MGKFINALKNLGNKLNGTTPTSTKTVDVINEIANDYVTPTDTTYTAGTGINISAENVISATAELPANPATTDNKTYVLKLVNGVLTWVEETPAAE